jgi:type IX secretion system PorP/SprF family membrane protein
MKIGKIFTLIAIALVLKVSSTQAQDIHFSQFYVSNLTLNPATTGVMTCQMRVSGIYRNQWASVAGQYAYNTFGLGVEGKINAGKNDYVGVGLNVWVDRAGASAFTSVQATISGSYLKKIGGRRSNEHYLVAGAQLGFTQRSIRMGSNLKWGNGWDGTQYDGSLGSGEDQLLGGNTRSFPAFDLSAGLLWFSALDKNNDNNLHVGIGFQHLTQATFQFLDGGAGESLFSRFTIHGGAEARLGRRMALVPNFAFYVQGPSFQMNVGTGFKFDFSKRAKSNQAFTVGAYVRGSNQLVAAQPVAGFGVDAIIAVIRLRFGSSQFGFSYDINVSKLVAATNANGAFELSYVWTLCNKKGRKLGCPSF